MTRLKFKPRLAKNPSLQESGERWTQTAKCGTWVDEAHQPVAKIRTNPHQADQKSAPIHSTQAENLHHSTSRKPGGSRYCSRHRQACRHSIHQSSITTPVHCAVSRDLSAGVHGHIQSASSGGGAARRWLARGGRRKVGAFSSLLPKNEWPKTKSLKKKVRALESSFQKVYTLGALALQNFSHRLLKVGHFQWFR